MDSLDLYRIAAEKYKKAMDYHDTIQYTDKNEKDRDKQFRERQIQKQQYQQAVFYFKLYESVAKMEERESKRYEK